LIRAIREIRGRFVLRIFLIVVAARPRCEYRAGIALSRRFQRNLTRLEAALKFLRQWPVDDQTAAEFADLFKELRAAGKMMSQFDLLIAAVARQYRLVVLTADADFQWVAGLQTENWLQPASPGP